MRKIKYIMSILFLISTFFSMMTYNYYYMFGHIMDYPFFLVILQWLKISCILLIVLGIYMHNNKAANLLKYISLIIIFQLFYMNSYFDNKFIPSSSDDEIIRNINTLFPIYITKFLYVFEIVSLFTIGIICNLEDKKLIIKDFIYIPLVMLCVIPLNLFDNIVRILPQSVVQVLRFRNFTIWHLLALVLVFVVPCVLYISKR